MCGICMFVLNYKKLLCIIRNRHILTFVNIHLPTLLNKKIFIYYIYQKKGVTKIKKLKFIVPLFFLYI